jgi:hypothetical protein
MIIFTCIHKKVNKNTILFIISLLLGGVKLSRTFFSDGNEGVAERFCKKGRFWRCEGNGGFGTPPYLRAIGSQGEMIVVFWEV